MLGQINNAFRMVNPQQFAAPARNRGSIGLLNTSARLLNSTVLTGQNLSRLGQGAQPSMIRQIGVPQTLTRAFGSDANRPNVDFSTSEKKTLSGKTPQQETESVTNIAADMPPKLNYEQFIDKAWSAYLTLNPTIAGIRQLFVDAGETVINDHIAFRTFNLPNLNIDALSPVLIRMGYEPMDTYRFDDLHANAQHFKHSDPNAPKIFVSQLELTECSTGLQEIVKGMAKSVPEGATKRDDFLISGRPWPAISLEDYQKLEAESPYTAWVATVGFMPNHFTILANALSEDKFSSLADVNAFVHKHGYALNGSPDKEINGSPDVFLEQSSTEAKPYIETEFAGGEKLMVPGVFYEFAKRYPTEDGELFDKFVDKNAREIFKSTDRKP